MTSSARILLVMGVLFLALVFIGIIKLCKRIWAAILTVLILAVLFLTGIFITGDEGLKSQVKEWIYELNPLLAEEEMACGTEDPSDALSDDLSTYYVDPLPADASSNVQEGSARYGAILQLGELDDLGRSTWAHIRLSDDQEPGNNGEERNEYINVDPVGWRNFKIHGNWANNRCHLVGYQFSGLNDELRNLSIGTSYLNKGTEGSGTDEDNPDGMLFYEQRLDDWLSDHPDRELDLYVRPVYEGSNTTPTWYYMQWVGFAPDGKSVMIQTGGHAEVVVDTVSAVLLKNQSPSYQIDYSTGIVTAK